jgi:hypothetical protein
MKKQNKDQPAPDLSEIELLLPDGWLKIEKNSETWTVTIDRAGIVRALINYYRAYADKLAMALQSSLQPNERFTEERACEQFVFPMALRSLAYIDNHIEQAVPDAIKLVLFEALQQPAKFFADIVNADEATKRAAKPPRKNIEKKALQLLRKRLASLSFRGRGRVGEWTSLELRDAVLEAMKQIENRKNRTKGRVAAIFYGEEYEHMPVGRRKAVTTALNELMEDKVDYGELERIDEARREGKVN